MTCSANVETKMPRFGQMAGYKTSRGLGLACKESFHEVVMRTIAPAVSLMAMTHTAESRDAFWGFAGSLLRDLRGRQMRFSALSKAIERSRPSSHVEG